MSKEITPYSATSEILLTFVVHHQGSKEIIRHDKNTKNSINSKGY